MSRLHRLLRPQSIAVLGGAWADTVAEQCAKLGFEGEIYRVHPTKAGCFRSLDELPGAPDAAFLGVNRELTIDVVAKLAAMGAGGAVCFAAGYSELNNAEGRELAAKLKRAAAGMPFLGPNCYGMVNFFERASLFPDQVPVRSTERGVCIISQSGTFGCNMLYAGRSLPIGYLITVGNQAVVGMIELMEAALQDERVSTIGLYIECMPDAASFRDVVLRARAQSVPVVVCKAGRSEAARRTAMSHSGAMGSTEHYLDALFVRLGVVRCATPAAFIETLKILHVLGAIGGRRIVLAGASGGDLAIAADLASNAGLELPQIEPEIVPLLKQLAGGNVTVANPFDFQTAIWHDPAAMRAMFEAMMRIDADLFGFILDHPDPAEFDSSLFDQAARAFVDAARATGKPAMTLSVLPETTPTDLRQYAIDCGVLPAQGLDEGLQAAAAAARISQKVQPPCLDLACIPGEGRLISEWRAKQLLASAGLSIPRGMETTASRARISADEIGYPVVLKATGLAHKSDQDGVFLNLQDAQSVLTAATRLGETILVEEMISGGVAEIILGVDFDPEAGPVILLGAGGVLAEIWDDKAFLLPPVDTEMADRALSGLKIDRLLKGYRGKPAGDRKAVIDAMVALSGFVEAMSGRLLELDINPLIVRQQGQGAIAADALIRLIDTENQ